MRYFALILLFLFNSNAFSQELLTKKKVYGTVINGTTSLALPNANIININKVRGSTTDTKGAFEIDADVSSKIKLRIIGGKGNDTFNLKGNIKSNVYDLNTEKNYGINEG